VDIKYPKGGKMSILIKPYEIAVYEDVLQNDGSFKEVRLGIIGSDKMIDQSRALEPNLIRGVNGQKTFSFKMYKQYIDTMTGEKVDNPFSSWLISERKVKLKYGKHINDSGEEVDTWYDFIIKDISENSSNYLYTYQLEDALVQELSKNGFGKTLDAKLNNNIGTAKELAKFVLDETDWDVESEVFVQKVDEALVYVKIPAETVAKHIIDQTSFSSGIDDSNTITFTDKAGTEVLAFYSSCTGKPHRF
jgi:hypothetical protein